MTVGFRSSITVVERLNTSKFCHDRGENATKVEHSPRQRGDWFEIEHDSGVSRRTMWNRHFSWPAPNSSAVNDQTEFFRFPLVNGLFPIAGAFELNLEVNSGHTNLRLAKSAVFSETTYRRPNCQAARIYPWRIFHMTSKPKIETDQQLELRVMKTFSLQL